MYLTKDRITGVCFMHLYATAPNKAFKPKPKPKPKSKPRK